jgi:hypothetical protein
MKYFEMEAQAIKVWETAIDKLNTEPFNIKYKG